MTSVLEIFDKEPAKPAVSGAKTAIALGAGLAVCAGAAYLASASALAAICRANIVIGARSS